VPQKLFWSVTVYDAETRSQIQTDQDKAALRSLVELKDVPKTGTTDLYFGPTAPAGKEGQWIKTNPGKGWFVYLRLYGPEGPAFNGSRKRSAALLGANDTSVGIGPVVRFWPLADIASCIAHVCFRM
jgi:hypothetical protein